jgi:hypothetical protein
MTTFAFTIILSDSEVNTVEVALKGLLKQCEIENSKAETAPYFAHRINTKAILKRLYDSGEQMSGNNFLITPKLK